jgi:hypothetical protein
MLASVIKNSTRDTFYSSLLYVGSLCLCITFEKIIIQKIQFKVVVKCQKTGCKCENFGGEMSSSGRGFWKMWP